MPDNTALYVVLDANILIRDFWMSGPSFSYLTTHGFLGHRPVIPEVAYLEVQAKLRERAELLLSNRSDGEGSHGNTMRLLRLFNYKRMSKRLTWNVDSLLLRWNRHLRRVLKQFGGEILPSPRVEIATIIQRSVQRRKPFTAGDKGFRDTLIWLSTLELVGPKSLVSFVTGNTQDFFSTGASEPHPDILAEAEERLDGSWKMLFHRSLDEFIAYFDADRTASAEALQRALISNTLSGFDLWEWLEDNLVGLVGEDDFDSVHWAGVPSHAEAPTLEEVEALISVDVPRAHHLQDDTYRFYCDLAFVGVFTCDIGFAKAESIVHPNQMLWKDETDSFWTEVGMRAVATFMMRIDYDVKAKSVVAVFARPLQHWSSYTDEIETLDNTYEEIRALEEES